MKPRARPRGLPARSPLALLLVAALAPVTWGTVYFVTSRFMPQDSPFWIAAIRAAPVGLLFVLLGRRRLHGSWWWKAAILGTLNIGLTFGGVIVAAVRLPGGVAATFIGIQQLVIIPFAWLLLRELPRASVWPAAIAGALGVALMVLGPSARLDALGVLAMFGAIVSFSWGMVLAKRWGKPMPTLYFTGWQVFFGGLFLILVAAVVEGAPPPLDLRGVFGGAYLGLVTTGLGYVLWFFACERLSAQTMSVLITLNPATAAVIGVLAAGEQMTGLQVLGLFLVFGSILIGRGRDRAAPPQRAADPTKKKVWTGLQRSL